MSEEKQNDMQAMLAQLLSQATAQTNTATGWNQPKPAAATASIGVAVPISLQTPAGKIRCYLQFGPDAASSPQALMGLLESLAAAGIPLDTWQPSGGQQWGGSGGGYNRGGFGGGYNRGGWQR